MRKSLKCAGKKSAIYYNKWITFCNTYSSVDADLTTFAFSIYYNEIDFYQWIHDRRLARLHAHRLIVLDKLNKTAYIVAMVTQRIVNEKIKYDKQCMWYWCMSCMKRRDIHSIIWSQCNVVYWLWLWLWACIQR